MATDKGSGGDVEMKINTTSNNETEMNWSPTPSENEPEVALHPIAILIDELKHVDISLRLNAIQKLSMIAIALGTTRTRTELIPFLKESVMDEEDEILLALTEQLGKQEFINFIGGEEYAYCLLEPLELLCGSEEPIVREKVIESIKNVSEKLNDKDIELYFTQMLNRLAKHSWYPNRTSASALWTLVLSRLKCEKTHQELVQSFLLLLQDDVPVVRRSAATHFKDILKVISKDLCMDEFYPAYLQILGDDQDSVRLLSVEILVSLSAVFNAQERKELCFPLFKTLLTDKSWRVRYMVAEWFPSLIEVLKDKNEYDQFLDAFVELLNDSEAEVRTVATNKLPSVLSNFLIKDIQNSIFPVLKDLTKDSSSFVRSAFALHVNDLAPIVGKDFAVDHLLPLLVTLLKDDISEVRLNVISKIERFSQVVGIQLLSKVLLPSIIELANDKHWRVRLAIIQHTPLLASQLGEEFYNESLSELTLALLTDKVFAVREAAIESLQSLTEIFGLCWAKKVIIPRMLQLAYSKNYLYRLTTLFGMKAFMTRLDLDGIQDLFVPTLQKLASDAVPNVRFNVAKTIEVLVVACNKNGTSMSILDDFVKPTLSLLLEDKDNDVRYFAKNALELVP